MGIRIGFVRKTVFSASLKGLWRDSRRGSLTEFVGWVICVEILAVVCSKKALQLHVWLCSDWQILVKSWRSGGTALGWKRNI